MGKRCFAYIRKAILLSIYSDNRTINSISESSNINWRTCENHLTYLCGRGLVKEVFSSRYARIFELTQEGRMYINEIPDGKDYDYRDVTKIMNKSNSDKKIVDKIKEEKKGHEGIDVWMGIPSI